MMSCKFNRCNASTGYASICVMALLSVSFAVFFLSSAVASADPIEAVLQSTPGNPDMLSDLNSYTIAEIEAAGGIIIGDKLFDLFTVRTTNSFNAVAPGADEILITPIQILKAGAPLGGDFGMIFNGAWSAPAEQLADSTIQFHASILPEYVEMGYAFKDNSLWITAYGVANNTDAGAVSVSENLYATHPGQGDPAFANKFVYYKSPTDNYLLDEKDFDPITEMWVIKDVVAYGGVGTVGMAHLSEFYQTFSQVPEPGTLVLLGFGAIGLAAYAWRKRR